MTTREIGIGWMGVGRDDPKEWCASGVVLYAP